MDKFLLADDAVGIKWDIVKCGHRKCLRLADLRCPKCPGEFHCQEHMGDHLRLRHGNKPVDDYGPKVCETCTDFKVEFYCLSCKLYKCFKCGHSHTHPVYPIAAPAPVVAHPSAPTVNPVAVQRPVKQEPASRVVHVAGESSVLPTRDDKTFITSSSLPNMPPLPHVRDNYLKGVMLDNYNKFNDQADQLDKAIRKLEVEARMNVSSASMSVALSAVNRRSELQRALEDVFRQRDEAVAQVIVYDPPVLAQYDAAQDPANPLYKAPVHNPTIAQRFVPLKHGMCAKIELKIQGLLTQWVRLQDQMVAALSDHDVPAMERLQEEIESLESQMCLQDTQRAAQFVEISAFSDRVRQFITHYRENVPRT
ncbi:hypothetical protein DYB32_000586 [Aphanomyces invadans]|uniref:C2H2-type domain-containing protein n=1 Tax=Aphanomyces invadans TaxID=157072 RepID=A0A418B9K5_9STRA|nr:hypothetical protein DYB32_000586 [Aphanomyces invadans]